MDERYFARFEYKVSLGRLSYIAQGPDHILMETRAIGHEGG